MFTFASMTQIRRRAYWIFQLLLLGFHLESIHKKQVAMFFLTLLIALMVFTFIQPYLPGQKNPIEVYLSEETGKQDRNQPPSADYWFGTNSIGQDLWGQDLERYTYLSVHRPGRGPLGCLLWVSSSALSGAM